MSSNPLAAKSPANRENGSRVTVPSRIAEVVRASLSRSLIEDGTVLLEGALAQLLGTTRTPVRQALKALEAEGLISRFEGRGYLAGQATEIVKRVQLTSEMLGMESAPTPIRNAPQWEAIYNEVERELTHFSVLGRYRVNETELARHFGVGRIVARDVLMRLESLGLIQKDDRQRWEINPLDDKRIADLYELRVALEPIALRSASAELSGAELRSMTARLRSCLKRYARLTREEIGQLESDLHVCVLSHCPNADLLHTLQRTRGVLMISKHALGQSAPMPSKEDAYLTEHLEVFLAISAGRVDDATHLLKAHLESSRDKIIARADSVRANFEEPLPAYICER